MPFIAVDCSTLVPTLMESELFGHNKGAFTGALKSKAGLFQAANGGTIFLEEIGELPLDMQAKPGTEAFFAGNTKFLTRKLWGAANEPPYFHHGQFTTMREAILAHAGEAPQPTTPPSSSAPVLRRDK